MTNYQAATPTTAEDPGKTLGIIGLVLAIVVPLVGLIISAVALNQSKKAGFDNKLAKIGLIVGIVLTIVAVVGTIAYIVFVASIVGTGGF